MRFQTFFHRLRPLLLPTVIGIVISIPVWVMGVPGATTGDLRHHLRIANGFHEALIQGDLYPSWIAPANDGYGDPSGRFYPPVLYLSLSVIQYIVNDWYYSFLVAITIINIIGSIGMFLWAKDLSNNHTVALVTAAIFLLSTFHVFELYIAQYPQYAATCLVPYLFFFIDRIFKKGGSRNIAGAGLFLALIICWHVPTTVYIAFSLAIYCLLYWMRVRDIRILFSLGTTALLGLILSFGYLITILLELKWKQPSGIGQGAWFDYRNNFLFQMPLSEGGELMLRDLALMSLILFVPNIVLIIKRDKNALGLFALCVFTFFMITPVSQPIWDRFYILQETQLPYRWLSLTAVFTSALLSLSLNYISDMWKSHLRPVALVLIGMILVSLSFSPSQIMKGLEYQNLPKFHDLFKAERSNTTFPDFLPIWTDGKLQAMSAPVQANRDVKIIEWGQNTKVFEVGEGAQTQARIKLLYYPRWSAIADGNEILETTPSADGALLVTLPPHAARVSIEFVEPLTIKIATVVSLLGFMFISIMFLFGKSATNDTAD